MARRESMSPEDRFSVALNHTMKATPTDVRRVQAYMDSARIQVVGACHDCASFVTYTDGGQDGYCGKWSGSGVDCLSREGCSRWEAR